MPNHTYRAFKNEWVGLRLYPPDVAVHLYYDSAIVYASWNGSTETTAWQVLAGSTPYTLSVVVFSFSRTGFETDIEVHSIGPYFQVNALNSDNKVIGRSWIVRVNK